jgi:hypothetical protein
VPDARLSVNVLKFTGGYPGGTTNFLREDGTFAAAALPPGADEVFVGTSDPGAAYELWYDTDEPIVPTGTTHAITHETGGTDPITNLSATVLTSGTLPDARLSTNVPLKNVANTFTQNQTTRLSAPAQLFYDESQPADNHLWVVYGRQTFYIGAMSDSYGLTSIPLELSRSGHVKIAGNLAIGGVALGTSNVARTDAANTFTANQTIDKATPIIRLRDSAQPADARLFRIFNDGQHLIIDAINDAETVGVGSVVLERTGDLKIYRDVYEKQRTTPLGHWIDVPYNAANFTASAGTWTVPAGNVYANGYTVIGKTLYWSILIIGSTVSTTAGNLRIAIPFGSAGQYCEQPILAYDGTVWLSTATAQTVSGVSHVTLRRDASESVAWPASPASIQIRCVIIIRLS